MPWRRRYVLGALLLVALGLTAVLLSRVVGTVFFAITVAYLLSPVRHELTRRGLSPWAASLVSTLAAFVGTVAIASPLVIVVAVRLEAILALVDAVRDQITIEVLGFTYVVTIQQAQQLLITVLRSVARASLRALPILLIKLTLFAFLVFSLLLNEHAVRRGVLAVIPPTYRDVAQALDRRIGETLFAIYVLQAATSFGTFLIAVPVFFFLGYQFITLATVSAVLQFFPVIGPSLILFGIAAYEVAMGNIAQAALVVVVGGFLVAWLPDVLIRPWLARDTTNLSAGLYFIGFVGGLLSLGPVGIIAGPLAIVIVVELANLVSTEFNDIPVEDERTEEL